MNDRRAYPALPMVGAGAIIIKGGRVLLVRRNTEPNAGLWAIPGGLVEVGETCEEAAVREAKEEVGLDVSILRLSEVVSDIVLDESGRVEYHFVIIDYLARVAGGKIRLNSESSDCGWFTPSEVRRLHMAGRTKEVVLRCISGSGTRPRA